MELEVELATLEQEHASFETLYQAEYERLKAMDLNI